MILPVASSAQPATRIPMPIFAAARPFYGRRETYLQSFGLWFPVCPRKMCASSAAHRLSVLASLLPKKP
jgi:hypothetical protein